MSIWTDARTPRFSTSGLGERPHAASRRRDQALRARLARRARRACAGPRREPRPSPAIGTTSSRCAASGRLMLSAARGAGPVRARKRGDRVEIAARPHARWARDDLRRRDGRTRVAARRARVHAAGATKTGTSGGARSSRRASSSSPCCPCSPLYDSIVADRLAVDRLPRPRRSDGGDEPHERGRRQRRGGPLAASEGPRRSATAGCGRRRG
jgi:hypothetical protein